MLTLKIRNNNDETLIEAENCRYEGARESNPASLGTPAMVLAFGVPGASMNPIPYHQGIVFVMNDKGRTIATYDLDMDNRGTLISEEPRPASPPPHPPHADH